MKFVVSLTKHGGRRGVLSELGGFSQKIDTPTCMVYTRGGLVPHLTPDISEMIHARPFITEMPLPLLVEHVDAIESYGQGLVNYTSTQGSCVLCTVQDAGVEAPSGYNTVKGVSLWGRKGNVPLNVSSFMRMLEACQPDCYQALSDADTHRQSSRKRVVKSVDRTLEFLDEILELHNKSPLLKTSCILGSVGGGYVEAERVRSARETALRDVSGFVIEGFNSRGPETENLIFGEIKELISATLNELPVNKPRLMQSVWPPHSILEAVQAGIDLFDSSYPYIVTERSAALTFQFTSHSFNKYSCDITPSYEINLTDTQYFDDFTPILDGCTCRACTKFTRAYVHHLLNTSELLASVLLMIHNVHHYYGFFAEIREALADDRFAQLRELIDKQKPDTKSVPVMKDIPQIAD